MKRRYFVREVMTPMPHTIGSDINTKTALEIMRKYGIRHLPVLSGGKLEGMVTDRDLNLITCLPQSDEILVEDVMSQNPFTVSANDDLNDVVGEMAERKIGSAIVENEEGTITGIFTVVDAMKMLYSFLEPQGSDKTP